MSTKKQKWIAVDGSIYVDLIIEKYNPEFKVKYEMRPTVAFNIGQDVAEHIVKLHNKELENGASS